ncbi:MAG: acyltransferase family protein [Patescibacteria group bacterium]|nr:MAG: acyltransferase family protein [Patescibacteria group bacterium]
MQDSTALARPTYRPDIDGLRGLAVLAVVAFHAFPEWVPAGFMGVDIFFVISGFLIASIILSGLEKGSFSFLEFYARRVRRIFPSLIIVLIATFVAGWLFLSKEELLHTGKHLLGGATFSSNFLLWEESGYFDVESDRKVLLHLWSLAIEEQFYLVFPLLLWGVHRLRARPLVVLSAGVLASFAWNIAVAKAQPVMDFYAPQTRAWELLLGAVLASSTHRPSAILASIAATIDKWLIRGGRDIPWWPKARVFEQFCAILGAFLLAFGFAVIIKEDLFPSWWALLPTLGAALLISAGANAWINRRVLSQRTLVWCGLISFPLYLWHWPLLSYSRIVVGVETSWVLKSGLVAVSIILAWLTYRFVEKPVRYDKLISPRTLLVALAALGVIGVSVMWSDGFAFRSVSRKLETYLRSVKLGAGGCVSIDDPAMFCRLGAQDAPLTAFVTGDSHAESMRPAFAAYARAKGQSFVFGSSRPPLLGLSCPDSGWQYADPYAQRNRQIFEYVKEHGIRDVFLVARWTNYNDDRIRIARPRPSAEETMYEGRRASFRALQEGLEQTIEAYRAIGVHVYLVVDNPLQKYRPVDVLRRSERTDDTMNALSLTTEEHETAQGWMAALLHSYAGSNVTVLDFTDVYCLEGRCPLVKNGRFLYFDSDHLSEDGAMLVYPALEKALRKGAVLQ